MLKNKKIVATILTVAMAMCMSFSAFAAEPDNELYNVSTEEITYVQNVVEFIDGEGNVIATFTPYSETDPAPSELQRTTTYIVDVQLGGNMSGALGNVYTLSDGHRIDLNITIDPQVSCNIGLFNNDSNVFGFPAGGLSSSGWYGYITVHGDGRYSLAFKNNSSTTTTFKGTYTL